MKMSFIDYDYWRFVDAQCMIAEIKIEVTTVDVIDSQAIVETIKNINGALVVCF